MKREEKEKFSGLLEKIGLKLLFDMMTTPKAQVIIWAIQKFNYLKTLNLLKYSDNSFHDFLNEKMANIFVIQRFPYHLSIQRADPTY